MRIASLLALGFPAAFGIRLGDDAQVSDKSHHRLPKDKAKKFTQKVVDFFADEDKFPKDREVLSAIRSTEMDGGSSGQKRKYEYLGAKCLFQRSKWAAKTFKEAGCKRILEVGGYSSPLPSVVEADEMPDDMEFYMDVDPSANESKLEDFSDDFPTATFQIILSEFVMHDKPVGKSFDCFLMLGTTAQNVGTSDKAKALTDALGTAKLAILEYPSSNPDTPGLMTPPVEEAGLKKTDTHMVDCSSDKEAVEKKDPECGSGNACLKRNIVVYKRKEEEKKKSKSKDD